MNENQIAKYINKVNQRKLKMEEVMTRPSSRNPQKERNVSNKREWTYKLVYLCGRSRD